MIETFFDVDELVAAVEAVRGVSSLPVVALLTFDEDGETVGGVSASTAAERLSTLDVAAIGTNHGAGPHAALTALARMGSDGLPLVAMPNVGLASIVGRPRRLPALEPGLLRRVRGARPRARRPDRRRVLRHDARPDRGHPHRARRGAAAERAVRDHANESSPWPPAASPDETLLAQALRNQEWVTCVELDPPKGGTNEAMLAVARTLKESGKVDFVDINDNPMARARMNALMASIAIERDCGLETIPHVTPRDTTVMGLEGVLLGAHAEGVRNILAVTGDPPHVGDYPGSRGVYEVDSIGLVQLLDRLNSGEDYIGKAIDAPTSFFVGVAVNPSADDLDLELERFERKLAAGARFAMTQALFDLAYLDVFLSASAGGRRCRCSSASGRSAATRWPFACTTRCRGSSCPSACRRRSARRAPGGRGRARAGPRPPRRVAGEGGRDLRDPAVQAARGRAGPPRAAATTGRRGPWRRCRSLRDSSARRTSADGTP